MSGAINFSGISSGIDTNLIISEEATIERQPEQILQQEQTNDTNLETAYGTVSANLVALQSAAQALDNSQAFQVVTAASSTPSVASVTVQPGAQISSHTLSVSTLAQAQIISSAPQSSDTAPLNFTGQIVINGQSINVQSADSLESLASDINTQNAGVTASIISPTQGQYYLTLGSNNSGLQGAISLSDVGTGTLLNQLGFLGSTGAITHQLSGSVGSDLFTDSATSVATLLGQTTPSSGTVQITTGSGTQSVNIDLSQSLSQIATNINTAFGATVATVATVTNPITNASEQQLQIAGATGFTDSNNVLANLGIYEKSLAAKSQTTAAQDATYTLDGLPGDSPTNTITSAISDVSFTLLQGATGTPPTPSTTTLSISPDTATITSNINAFVTAYNATVDGINNASTYDSTTGTTGILFGDLTTSSINDQLALYSTEAYTGLPTSLSTLSQIGITLSTTGDLQVDSTALASALSSNLSGVAQLFQASGTASNPLVQFVNGGPNTQPSGSAGYAVNVTAAATQATYTAAAQTQPLAASETLTFAGPLFGTSSTASPLVGPAITLNAGDSVNDVVSQINANSTIGAVLSASVNAQGELQLTSKLFGSSASFSVSSTAAAAANTSGIGTAVQTATGTDVQGTINGEAATGNGQFLTGSQQGSSGSGNGQALGLQLRVTATQPGSYGTITYSSGAAELVDNYVTTQTDPNSGVLTLATSALQTQYNDLQTSIDAIETQVSSDETLWQQEFTNMETTVANLKAASAGLSSLGVSSSSSSSVGSSLQ